VLLVPPAAGVEEIIKLRARVKERLAENAEVVGTDEAFLRTTQYRRRCTTFTTRSRGFLDGELDTEVDLAPTPTRSGKMPPTPTRR